MQINMKLGEMIYLIAKEFEDNPDLLGYPKMNIICWFCDTDWNWAYKESMSGETTYGKTRFGPRFYDNGTLLQLEVDQVLDAHVLEFEGYQQTYYTILDQKYKIQNLTKDQCKLIKAWCDYAKTKSTRMMSKLSKAYMWWGDKVVQEGISVDDGYYIDYIPECSLMHDSKLMDKRLKESIDEYEKAEAEGKHEMPPPPGVQGKSTKQQKKKKDE